MHHILDQISLRSDDSGFSGSECDDNSDKSHNSYTTAPTEFGSSERPPFVHNHTCAGRLERHQDVLLEKQTQPLPESPRSSTETYASTIDSDIDGRGDDESGHVVPSRRPFKAYPCDVLPATPADFSDLFPSSRQLSIKHDDSTDDGNMNLRLDTSVHIAGGVFQDITLFHLRMQDLKKREFSLRRYCRDSGREVCHTIRKYQESSATGRRPSLGRSLSNMFAAFKSISESKSAVPSNLKRSDSGYGSIRSRNSLETNNDFPGTHNAAIQSHSSVPTNTTKLEFSNYSQVDVKRRGSGNSKRYDFEYWGTDYCWKRSVNKSVFPEGMQYHLHRAGDVHVLARIEPSQQSPEEALEEQRKGGWIPPCVMQICDRQILDDHNEAAE